MRHTNACIGRSQLAGDQPAYAKLPTSFLHRIASKLAPTLIVSKGPQ